MPEVYSWPEASISVWTANHVPVSSALLAFAENLNVSLNYGWENKQTLTRYDDYSTGRMASLTVGLLYTKDTYVQQLADLMTAVHIKCLHSSVNGTAGVVLYSGRIDTVSLVGNEGQVFRYTLSYHSNRWSGF